MSSITQPSTCRYTLSVTLDDDFSSTETLLRRLSSAGIVVRSWRLASTEWPGQTRLIVDLSGDRRQVFEIAAESAFDSRTILIDQATAAHLELAIITVDASGDRQDEAASLLASAGGQLVSLKDDHFTAQITGRPEAIDSILSRLAGLASVRSVRSGGLAIQLP
ncbi:MAG: hypothetical protein P4L46_23410 [Fimbriimonas sp.]|nr:hypothetical protein [Fimbriimonas sp.]